MGARRLEVAMIASVLLLLAVELPLGPFGQPGVPVLVTSEEPVDLVVDGWTWRIDGPTAVALPRLPCDVAGTQVRAPKGELVGVVGRAGEGEVALRLVEGMPWQPLLAFDRIEVRREVAAWEHALLDRRAKAGAAPPPGLVLPEIYDVRSGRGVGSASRVVMRRLALGMGVVFALLVALAAFGRRG
ncbi:MAG: hypothetical protein AAGD14_15795, partial [Planctomycetota bacterium]